MRLPALGLWLTSLAAVCSAEQLSLPRLEREIADGHIPKLTSLIVSQNGHLVYEYYYGEGGPDHLNNTRSATKTITALAFGRAIADGKIAGVDTLIMPYFGELAGHSGDPLKAQIRVKDLLTMSSAIAADDSDRSSPGNEDRMHEHSAWTPWALGLPMTTDYRRNSAGYGPFRYATVNAVLAGQVLERVVQQPVDRYIAETLFQPLGITDYKFQKSPSGEVMTGGGIELRSIDLWRIGEMILENGRFEGRQVVPSAWIKECLTLRHANTGQPGIGYGYLIWHRDFALAARKESAWFMAGNGGNLVVVVPNLHAVVVLTRTAFNLKGAAAQSAQLVEEVVLPMVARVVPNAQ